ncbi:MAG: adenylate/guanylate cyclase domain-containing protein [Alphaproteobacteria bacterium]|nr:adenylate/guanylate cyclase domain-containing protein [Alphaproteobacteria bacterium]
MNQTKHAGPNRGIPIAAALIVGVGLLVAAAMAMVYVAGYEVAHRNTVELIRQRGGLILSLIDERIHNHLQPASAQLDYLAKLSASGRIDPENAAQLGAALAASLAAAPQISVVAFVNPDLRVVRAFRNRPGGSVRESDWSDDPVFQRIFREAAQHNGPYWGELFVAESVGHTFINLRVPVRRQGRLLGVLIAGVSISELSAFLAELRDTFSETTFILYGRDHVLAHPLLLHGYPGLSDQNPLPELQQFNDPVLREIWAPARHGSIEKAFAGPARIRVVDYLEQPHVFMFRTINHFGAEPWLVGTHAPLAKMAGEYKRLELIPLAGLGALVLAFLVTYVLARALSQPVRRLADGVVLVRDLDIKNVPLLPYGPFRELNQAASAFNAMVASLKWFETYVPRTLVRRLMQQRDGGEIASEEREMSILFTDIQGFTALAEQLPARQLAGLLNEHFTLIDRAIEAEGGTVDKYLGDGAMAFWGAPDRQADHAARACRAAVAIARAVVADNVVRRGAGKPPIRTRIGVHSGNVVVGNIGAPSRVNYTIVGDAVNVAERISEIAREVLNGSDDDTAVCFSGQTVAQWGDGVTLTPLGQREMRGHHEPVEVFCLGPTESGPAESPFEKMRSNSKKWRN